MTPQPKPQRSPKAKPRRIARGPVRRVSKRPSAVARRKADREWARDIRAFGFCERCDTFSNGYVRLDAHHVWGKKAYPTLRHERDNGVALCRQCHTLAHAQPVTFRGWFAGAYPLSWTRLEALKQEKA